MVVYAFLRLASIASAASSRAFLAKVTSGRPSSDGDQHLAMKFHTSSETHSFDPGGRAGRSPVTTLYMITPSLAPRKGLLFCNHLYAGFSRQTLHNVCDTHLVRDHSKCIDVTPFFWVAVPQIKTGGVQKFRGNVPDGNGGNHRLYNVVIKHCRSW